MSSETRYRLGPSRWATWPAPTPDLAEAQEPVAAAEEPVAVAEEAPAPVKERRRTTRAPRKRKDESADTAVTAEAVAQEDSVAAPDAQAAVADVAAEGEDDVAAAKQARKKSTRPAHKAPSRKPATRAPRRPAKPKTPPENG